MVNRGVKQFSSTPINNKYSPLTPSIGHGLNNMNEITGSAISLKNKSERVKIAKQETCIKRRDGTKNNIGTIRENLGMRGPIQVRSCPAASPCSHVEPEL